jgi:hypothetical protein
MIKKKKVTIFSYLKYAMLHMLDKPLDLIINSVI